MNVPYAVLLLALAILAIRSMIVLRSNSKWTSAGWGCTLLYCFITAIGLSNEPLHRLTAPIEWALLIGLTIAFVIAGVRDERQAEPWYWPAGTGKTRAERR